MFGGGGGGGRPPFPGQGYQPHPLPPVPQPAAAEPETTGTEASWGLTWKMPQAWFSTPVPGSDVLILASHTRAGLMLFRRYLGVTEWAQIVAEVAKGIHESGISLMPIGPLQPVPGQPRRGDGIQQVELQGYEARGIFAVQYVAEARIAVAFLAVTTPMQYAGLRRDADRVIATMQLDRTKLVGAGSSSSNLVARLSGTYWGYSGNSNSYSGSSYSRERTLVLQPSGRYIHRFESAASVQSGGYASDSGDQGVWVPLPGSNEHTGALEFRPDSGFSTRIVQYQVSSNPRDRSGYGPAVSFDGILLQRTG